MPDQIGDPKKRHPLPMRLRNAMVDKDWGGAKGYRGKGFATARKRALYKARHTSYNTGLTRKDVKLEVDHIAPYRQCFNSSLTNHPTNHRITDFDNNKYSDYAQGFEEKPPRRRLPGF